MSNNDPRPIDNLTYVLNLIKFLPQALNYCVADRSNLLQDLQSLNDRTCTGHAHWRDKDKPGKTAKLYILHRTDQCCPMHGQPAPGERLRVYVGNKPDRIADALAAMERETQRLDIHKKLNRLDGKIGYAMYQLKNLYTHLDHYPPDQRDQRPALPIPNGSMATG